MSQIGREIVEKKKRRENKRKSYEVYQALYELHRLLADVSNSDQEAIV